MAMAMQFDQATEDLIFSIPELQPVPYSAKEAVTESAEKAKTKVEGVVAFADWLEKNFPDIYKAAMQSRPDLLMPEFAMAGLAGLGDATSETPSTDWGKAFSDFVNQVLGPLAGAYQQKKLIDLNIKRAEQGLPPINAEQMAPTVNVGIAPSLQTGLLIAGAVVLGVLLLRKR